MQMQLAPFFSRFQMNAMSSLSPSGESARELESFLHEKIPLSRAMEVCVVESSGKQLVLEAPLAANVNHLGTAFGGSLHALPTLACYATLWTLMREAALDGHVVVKHTETSYRQPVKSRLRTVCVRPPAKLVAKFMDDLLRHKKARMELKATVDGENGKPAVEFHGTFVALT